MGFLSYRNCSFNLLSIRYNKLLESIYFKRANKLNKKMGDKLRKRRRKARRKDWKERDRQEQNN